MAGSRTATSGVLTTLLRRKHSQLTLFSSRKTAVSMMLLVCRFDMHDCIDCQVCTTTSRQTISLTTFSLPRRVAERWLEITAATHLCWHIWPISQYNIMWAGQD